ncbi:hypothetical protein [Clostridioides difficile]|uniref:hypothetical protein n=1 Tax=Clostridioides difficile TaxID=1496 RepID=UPI002FCF26C8|nr:hypothetical protein [Clostridioides difficile]
MSFLEESEKAQELRYQEIHFLNFLDESKKHYAIKNNIKYMNAFFYYKSIEFEEKISKHMINKFILLKRNNTNILITEPNYGIKLYISDYDIISILVFLLNSHAEYGNFIIDKLIDFIEGKYEQYIFNIDECYFKINGISLAKNKDVCIATDADFKINLYEFMMLINLILEKERISGNDIVKGTIGKYILISKYYSSTCEEKERKIIARILEEHEINIDESLEYNKNIINKTKRSKKKVGQNIPKLLIPYDEYKEYNV